MQQRSPRYGKGVHVIEEAADELAFDVKGLKLQLLALFRSPSYRPPLLPVVAVELLGLSRKPRVTSVEISELLGRDPMLAGQVLKVAQSALYSRGEPVRSLDQAIIRLGLDRVTDLFFQASLEMRVFRAPGYESEMETLRMHSVFTAEMARMVSRVGIGSEDYAFLCGLLHDVGIAACILALNEVGAGRAKVQFEVAWPSVREIHESCSELLAKIWGLPADIGLVLSMHHTLVVDGKTNPLAAAIAIADGLAEEVGFGFRGSTSLVATEAAAALAGVPPATLEQLRHTAALMAEKFARSAGKRV